MRRAAASTRAACCFAGLVIAWAIASVIAFSGAAIFVAHLNLKLQLVGVRVRDVAAVLSFGARVQSVHTATNGSSSSVAPTNANKAAAVPSSEAEALWPLVPPSPFPLCSAHQRRAQSLSFTAARRSALAGKAVRMSACAESDAWMAPLIEADLRGSSGNSAALQAPLRRMVLNVGANKGYLAAALLSRWRPASRASPAGVRSLIGSVPGVHERNLCGICYDCREAVPSLPTTGTRQTTMSVHAVEPAQTNFRLLQRFAASLVSGAAAVNASGAANVGADTSFPPLVVHEAAVSDYVGTARFADRGVGHEGSSLTNVGESTAATVRVTTVDALVASGEVPLVPGAVLDMLVVDTEGDDARVLRGATATLNRTRLVLFEYHGIGGWSPKVNGSSSLKDTIVWLDRAGFDCYLLWTGGSNWRLSGCWVDAFETRSWSNVVCVNRRDAAWSTAMARTALRRWRGKLIRDEAVKRIERLENENGSTVFA